MSEEHSISAARKKPTCGSDIVCFWHHKWKQNGYLEVVIDKCRLVQT